MSAKWKIAAIRAVRTFVAAFVAVEPIPAVLGWLSGSQPIDVSTARAAAVAGIAAVVSLAWRAFIDPLPVPTLADKSPYPAVDGDDSSAVKSA